jgi:uncharacterized membrane protein
MIARATLAFLGLLGLAISLFFTLVYYGKMRADAPSVPKLCRLENSSCQELIRMKEAHLFGLPNFVIGLCFYLALLVFSFLPEGAAPLLERTLVLASGGAVTIGIFLSYVLVVRLRTNCILCFASHLINAFIFGLLLYGRGV